MIVCVEWTHCLLTHEHSVGEDASVVEQVQPCAMSDEGGVEELRWAGYSYYYEEECESDKAASEGVAME